MDRDAGDIEMRRSTGKVHVGRALWYTRPGHVELRVAPLGFVRPGEARVRTLFSGISRGTERLVLNGTIPQSEWDRMRAPLQEGAFPFPVKYGYCAAGIVEDGPGELMGQTVFCLHPHQDMFIAPATMLVPVPDGVTARRATLAANMETALNAHWDAASGPGDRIVVVGAGIVGLLVAYIAARLPGSDVTVIDVSEARRTLVESLGARFALPADCPQDADVVFHASATATGLQTALDAAGIEAAVVELSWYGEKPAPVMLGGAFHARRLRLVSSQVGQVSPSRRPRWTYRRRIEAALAMLADPALDALTVEEIAFEDAPARVPEMLATSASGLAPILVY
ncbi:MAG: zinc-binding alcohol dehydrogenase [Hyphomicrobiaceae bacterium]|nr:zinc-binding alcohol dehydrogenase [Hyphomicrobiaceae bacterium]